MLPHNEHVCMCECMHWPLSLSLALSIIPTHAHAYTEQVDALKTSQYELNKGLTRCVFVCVCDLAHQPL